jgi:hypothetical protein
MIYTLHWQEDYEEARILKHTVDISENFSRVVELFEKYDRDESGYLDEDEFRMLLLDLNLRYEERELHGMMMQIAKDNDELYGHISSESLYRYMKAQAVVCHERIHMLSTTSVYAAKQSKDKYYPPRSGHCRIEVIHKIGNGKKALMSAGNVRSLQRSVLVSNNASEMLEMGVHGVALRHREAEIFVHHMIKEHGNAVKALTALLPSVTSPKDAKVIFTFLFPFSFSLSLCPFSFSSSSSSFLFWMR